MPIVLRPIWLWIHAVSRFPLVRACRLLLVLLWLSMLTALVLPSRTLAETMYYVDSIHGADTNPGISPEQPWQTLAAVNARQFAPGDVVNLRRGSVWDGGLVINGSGQEGKPLRFTAYGSGDSPVIRNTTDSEWSVAVIISGNWVIVEGITVERASHVGITIAKGAGHSIIQDCQVREVGIGIEVLGEHNLVTRNLIQRLHMVHSDPGGDDDYGAVAVLLGGSGNEVSFNRMLQCTAPSYDYGTDGGAVEIYGDANGSYIHHNWAQGNNGFIEVGGGQARDTVVAYNLSFNNGLFACLHLGGTFGSQVSNFRVEHNTIVEGDTKIAGALFAFVNGDPSPETLILRNNVLYVTGSQMISNKPAITHDHNLYYLARGASYLGFDLGPNEKLADPLFVGAAVGNFHLRPGSPAIDAGSNLGYQQDWDGALVPSGSAPDLGAFEYGVAPSTATSTPLPTLAPSPTSTLAITPVPAATATRVPRYWLILPMWLQ